MPAITERPGLAGEAVDATLPGRPIPPVPPPAVGVKSSRWRRRIVIELAVIAAAAFVVAVLENRFDFLDEIARWLQLQTAVIDEVVATVIFLCLAAVVFSYRRWHDTQQVVKGRARVEAELRALQVDLEARVRQRTADLYAANSLLVSEVGERKAAEGLFRKSETLNRKLVEAAPIGILYLDRDTRITYENPAMRWMMGVPANGPSPVVGRLLFDVPPIRTALSPELTQAIQRGEVVSGATIHYHSLLGPELDLEVFSAPLNDDAGQREGTILLAANVTERAQAAKEIQDRLAELEAVNQISKALRTAQTLEEMLPVLLDVTLSLMHTTGGSISLYDPARDELQTLITRGWLEPVGAGPMAAQRPGTGITGHVFATGQPYSTADFHEDPRLDPGARDRLPAGGGICVPIRAGDSVIGTFTIILPPPRVVTPSELSLLTTVCEIAGNAIQRTTLRQQTERRMQELSALRTTDQAISSSFDMRISLNIILNQALTHLGADAAGVLLFNANTRMLEPIIGLGFRTPAARQVRQRHGNGYADRAIAERTVIHIANLALEPDSTRLAQDLAVEGFVSYYGVPLIAKGEIMGVLEIYQRAPLRPDADWLDFLQALAGQAAIAIDNTTLFDSLQRSSTNLARAYDATIEGWSRALDLRDKDTEGHTQRVAEMVVRLATFFGLSEAELAQVRWGALLHDIGKIGVPDGILLKPGPLTEAEWAVMKQHPRLAYELLAPIQYLRAALDIPYYHHEKWDGSGYPLGLKGEQIPLTARIFALVDVWDALSSDRPYRAAWTKDEVRAHVLALSGTHFDPEVVRVCMQSAVLES